MQKRIILISLALLAFVESVVGQHKWEARLVLSQVECQMRKVWFTLELKSSTQRSWGLADQNYRLFFDGDNMTVEGVESRLPMAYYTPVNIDQNIKVSGQGQEKYSPLDKIDDNLGFLDFSIVLKNKSNPSAAVQIHPGVYTPVADIAISLAELDRFVNGSEVSMIFSEASTAGTFTNQYTVITTLDGAAHTSATKAHNYQDLIPEESSEGYVGRLCAQLPLTVRKQILDRYKIQEFRAGKLELYPNPTFGNFRYEITGVDLKDHTIRIYDKFNRLVSQFKRSAEGKNGEVSVEDLPAGVYVFVVQTGTHQFGEQFVKTSK